MGCFRHRLAAPLLAALACLSAARTAREDPPATERQAIAIIVHPENPLADVKLAELRGLLRLDRQFWPDRTRVALYLPASESSEKEVLNARVYKMTEKELRKYWTGKVFAGDIPSIPPVVRTPAAAVRIVSRSPGAISAIPAKELSDGVKVLTIDGLAPDHPEYPLRVARPEPGSEGP